MSSTEGGDGPTDLPGVSESKKDSKRKWPLDDELLVSPEVDRLVGRSNESSGNKKRREVSFIGERRVLRSDVAKQREGSERNGTEQVGGDEPVQVEMVLMSGCEGIEVREDAEIMKKKAIDEVAPGIVKEISETDGGHHIDCEEEMEVDKKMTIGSSVDGQREKDKLGEEEFIQEVNIDRSNDKEEETPVSHLHENFTDPIKSKVEKKRVRRQEDRNKEVLVENKRITRSCVTKKREDSSTSKKNVTISGENQRDLMIYEESEIAEKLIMRSEFDTLQNKAMKPELARKKGRELLGIETTGNKLKAWSLEHSNDQVRDGLSEKEMGTEKIKPVKHSGQRTLKRRKDIGAHPVGVGITHQKGVGLIRMNGVLKHVSRNKKTGRFEKTSSRREDEESRVTTQLPGSGKQNATCCYSLYAGSMNRKKTSSVVSVGKGWLGREKTTSAHSKISHEPKRGYTQNNLDSTTGKSLIMVKGQSYSTSETPLSTRHIELAAAFERRTARQKLRDQIKDILLNADWKIEFKPRKGRGYDDSVYISPQGLKHWSILKAYDVFQSQFNHTDDIKVVNSLGESSKASKGKCCKFRTGSLFSSIPAEALSMLKKHIKRRRSKAELEEAKRKLEDGRSKKVKRATFITHPTSKHPKDKRRKFKTKIKRNNIVGSSDKGFIGYIGKISLPERVREKPRGIVLLARGSNQEIKNGTDVYVPYAFRRTVLSWMIDLGVMPASGKVKYMSKSHTQAKLEGWITRNGVHCSCCCKILTVSMFEVHAGSQLSEPYQNIYIEETGLSLLQCQINAWDKQEHVCRSFYYVDTDGDDPNDDSCGICGDGGDLICCDGCPSTFHLSCLDIQMLPTGNWHCLNCSCKFCCLVCDPDAQESGVTDFPLFSCSQCEMKYHLKCVTEGDAIPVCSNLPNISFCGRSCKKLFKRLQKLLGVKNDLEEGFSLTLLQRLDEDLPESICQRGQRIECNSKMAVALAVMDECFLPIIDQRSGINLIHNVVYNCGSNFSRLNYRCFYTFILERNDEIISVASLRIHGTRLAEMPFIGTRNMYRRQGMCRRLLNGIESVLCSLNIEKLIIPAISDLMDTWTNVFGFKPVEVSQKQELRSVNMLVFPGTGLLFKALQKKDPFNHRFGVYEYETCNEDNHTSDIVKESSACSFLGLQSIAPGDAIAQCKPEAKGIVPDSSEVSPEYCDSPCGSEPQALEYKSLAANDQSLLLHSELVYHVEAAVDSNMKMVSSFGPETKLTSESNAESNRKAECRGAEQSASGEEDAEQIASEVMKTLPYVAHGKEHEDSCVSISSTGRAIICVNSASVHSVSSTQHRSELHRKPSEILSDVDLPFAPDKLQQVKYDSVNSLKVTPQPRHPVSSKTNDDTGLARCTTGIIESLDVASVLNFSDKANVISPDGSDYTQQHVVVKGLCCLTPAVSDSSALKDVLDNHSAGCGNGPLAVSNCSIAKASTDHIGKDVGDHCSVVPDQRNLTFDGP